LRRACYQKGTSRTPGSHKVGETGQVDRRPENLCTVRPQHAAGLAIDQCNAENNAVIVFALLSGRCPSPREQHTYQLSGLTCA
jgi:hypothetical protein